MCPFAQSTSEAFREKAPVAGSHRGNYLGLPDYHSTPMT